MFLCAKQNLDPLENIRIARWLVDGRPNQSWVELLDSLHHRGHVLRFGARRVNENPLASCFRIGAGDAESRNSVSESEVGDEKRGVVDDFWGQDMVDCSLTRCEVFELQTALLEETLCQVAEKFGYLFLVFGIDYSFQW